MKIQETYEWLKIYEQGLINSADIARELNISERQFYRILQRYKTKGITGLQHQNKKYYGKSGNATIMDETGAITYQAKKAETLSKASGAQNNIWRNVANRRMF